MKATRRLLLPTLVGAVTLLVGFAAEPIVPLVSDDARQAQQQEGQQAVREPLKTGAHSTIRGSSSPDAHDTEETMNSDSGERLPDLPRADFSMPNVLDIQICATKFEAPRRRNFASSLSSSDEAVEFMVKTDGPIPIRAIGPALYVGGTSVTEMTEVGPNTYRFVAPTREGLKRDAPISLSWTGQRPTDVKSAPSRYRL